MVAEVGDSPPQGNGAAPHEPPAVPPAAPSGSLIGQEFRVPPKAPEIDTSQSVPPPSAPPATPVQPATPAQPAAVQPAVPAQEPAAQPQLEPAPASTTQNPAQPAAEPQAQPETPPAATQVQPVAQAAVPPAITPQPPPPGWYGDIFGNPPRWWDGTIWTEHVLVPLPSAEPAVAEDDVELNFFDNALISFSLAPDWARFLAAAVVAGILALIAFGILNGDSSSDDVPDGFVPQTPELEDGAIPTPPETPAPAPPDGSTDR